MKVGFVGAGAAAGSLAPACLAAGHAVVAVAAAHPASAAALAAGVPGCRAAAGGPQEVADAADLVFLAVPDDRIAPLAAGIRWRPGQMAVHLSGALTLAILAPAAAQGAIPGSLHPLFPLVRGRPADFHGAFFALEAPEPLHAVLAGVVAAAGGRWGTVPAEQRPLYHAAVTLVSNATVTVTAAAAACLEAIGLPDALPALLPLLRGAVENLARSPSVGAAITGPVGRGDAGVLAAHVRAVSEQRPELLPLFLAAERATLDLAVASGRLTAEAAAPLQEHLT